MLKFLMGLCSGLLISMAGLFMLWPVAPPTSRPTEAAPQASNLLVLGVDERNGDSGRSDAMLLVRLQADGPVRVLSLPRDTLVHLDGYGDIKLNSAYTYGGPDLATHAVSTLLDLPVDHYVKVNLSGFRTLVDLIGGVKINVEKPMHYADPEDGLFIDLEPGLQRLDGFRAEQYVRFRHDDIGDDIGRIHRQQEFLRAAASQALTLANLPRIPALLSAGARAVSTDLSLGEQVSLARLAVGAQQRGDPVQETLPGRGEYLDGISFFVPDRMAMQPLLQAWN